jgi:hypothetical protein
MKSIFSIKSVKHYIYKPDHDEYIFEKIENGVKIMAYKSILNCFSPFYERFDLKILNKNNLEVILITLKNGG